MKLHFILLTFSMILISSIPSESLASSYSSKRVVELVNKERSVRGLRRLIADYKLARVALAHAKDMYYNNYFSHQSKDGRTLGQRLKEGDIKYRVAGENIAKGQKTEVRVMQAWMNSAGHRRNILSQKFGRIGVARSGNVWVQVFAN